MLFWSRSWESSESSRYPFACKKFRVVISWSTGISSLSLETIRDRSLSEAREAPRTAVHAVFGSYIRSSSDGSLIRTSPKLRWDESDAALKGRFETGFVIIGRTKALVGRDTALAGRVVRPDIALGGRLCDCGRRIALLGRVVTPDMALGGRLCAIIALTGRETALPGRVLDAVRALKGRLSLITSRSGRLSSVMALSGRRGGLRCPPTSPTEGGRSKCTGSTKIVRLRPATCPRENPDVAPCHLRNCLSFTSPARSYGVQPLCSPSVITGLMSCPSFNSIKMYSFHPHIAR
mmetsp:Transcript_1830/g.2942  ORF Transcript_1830/g.2942 Transcript_1830/m.2942 type:complete len:292 (+) Transcript_1830:309-1184(+)